MNAKEKIDWKEQEQARYKKVGKKYVLCNDFDAYSGLEDGWWLIKVQPNCKSIRQCVSPAKAELLAAIKDKEDQILDVIRKASEARPKSIPLTEEQLSDWNAFISKHGRAFSTLEYPSMQENAEQILKILLNNEL